MNELHDILLPMPLSETWFRALLFLTFFLHFVFVLLTIGTAILGISYLVSRWLRLRATGAEEPAWSLTPFFVYKSLAIVLGVGPLLLMQVGHSVPFITAENLIGPLWMTVVVLLIVTLVLLEIISERKGRQGTLDVLLGLLGLACLLAIPGILSLVVVTTENPREWTGMLVRGGRLPWSLSWHWLFRVLHVLGAAVVVTAAVGILRARDDAHRRNLRGWILAGLAFQFALGIALYASLPRSPQAMIVALVVAGVAAAGALLWQMFQPMDVTGRGAGVLLLVLLAAILTPMLVTRQLLQDQVLLPFRERLVAQAAVYRQALATAPAEPGPKYEVDPSLRRQQPETLYLRSCVFCHGTVANGQGEDAPSLGIPPEDLSAIRAHRPELRRILREGVRGTAMPNFAFYTAGQIEGILDFLEQYAGLRPSPEPVPSPPSSRDRNEAARFYFGRCAACHGNDGGASELGRTLSPAPPDFRVYTLSPQKAFAVITQGYPGTLMPSFADLPQRTRWGLVAIVHDLYGADPAANRWP